MLGKTYMFMYSLEGSTSAFLLCRINLAPVRFPESVHHYILGPGQHTRVGRVLPLPLHPSLSSSSSPRLSINIELNKAFTTYPKVSGWTLEATLSTWAQQQNKAQELAN